MFQLFNYKFTLLCFFISSISTLLTQNFIDNKYYTEMYNKRILLHDIRDFLPIYNNLYITLFLDGTCILLSYYTCSIISKEDIKLFFFVYTVLMLLRNICYSITILPPPSPNKNKSIFIGGRCDAIFSGHTTLIVLNVLILSKYVNNYLILYLFSLFYSYILLTSRAHYSIDVFIAYILTISIYNNISNNLIILTIINKY
jgi:hypothetical protein